MGKRTCEALSHGSNVSYGVATLFSNKLTVAIKGLEEVNGRILCVNAEIEGMKFLLYAPNIGAERFEWCMEK